MKGEVDQQSSQAEIQENITPSLPPPDRYEIKLPDAIPTRWLNELKASARESRRILIITTILSSSLLTGFITTVATYYLEGRKTMLQLEMEDAKDTVHQYNLLRTDVNEFKYALNTAVLVFKQAAEPTANDAIAQNAGGQIASLIEDAAAMKTSVAKLNDQETADLIEAPLKPLTPALVIAKTKLKDKKALGDLAELCRKSGDEGVKKILAQIDKRKRELSARFYRL